MTGNANGDVWANNDAGYIRRGNAKSIFHGTGTEIAALDPVTPTSRYAFAGNGNDSVGSNNLTANGSPTYGSDGGVYGQYVILNGSSQYFTAANNTVFDVTTGDFSLWGYLYRVSDSGGVEVIADKRSTAGNFPGYLVLVNASDKLEARISDSGSTTLSATSTSSISTTVWYFWAASYTRAGNLVLHLYNMSTGAYETATTNISSLSASSITNTSTFTVGHSVLTASYSPHRYDHLNVLIGTAITTQNVQGIISKLHGGQIAECHGTSGGFTSGLTYKRDMENTTWNQLVDTNNTQTITGSKTFSSAVISTDTNTIKDSTTNNAGDILVNNGTKFVRKARGAAKQVVRMNSAANDIEFATATPTTSSGTQSGQVSTSASDNTNWSSAAGQVSYSPTLANNKILVTANGVTFQTGSPGGTSSQWYISLFIDGSEITSKTMLISMGSNGQGSATKMSFAFSYWWTATNTSSHTFDIRCKNFTNSVSHQCAVDTVHVEVSEFGA